MADDEIGLRQTAARGARAKVLLDDDLLKEAFAATRQRYVEAWLDSEARDDDGRQRCWLAIKNLDLVRDHLERVISGGAVAAKQIEFIEAKAKREKRA